MSSPSSLSFQELAELSKEALERATDQAALRYRSHHANLIAHLAEVERRGLGNDRTETPDAGLFTPSDGGPAERSVPRPAAAIAPSRPGEIEPCRPGRYNVRFSASASFTEKLGRLAEVLGIHEPHRQLARILEQALEVTLEQKDPRKRLERREARAAARGRAPATLAGQGERGKGKVRSRQVPVSIRDQVLAQAGHRCEYRGRGGVRCARRTGLEIHHQEPFARGGRHEAENLSALCRRHNAWFAERDFGADVIQRQVARR